MLRASNRRHFNSDLDLTVTERPSSTRTNPLGDAYPGGSVTFERSPLANTRPPAKSVQGRNGALRHVFHLVREEACLLGTDRQCQLL